MTSPLLEVDRLTVKRGMGTVLNQVSLRVKGGESVALVGPNGSGKSTLLESCARLLPVESGTVRHGGVSVVRPDGATSTSPVVVAVTLQKNGALGSETVEEHLDSAMSSAGATTDIAPFLKNFNLSHRRNDTIAHLSEGQARKVAVLAGLLPAFVASAPCLVLLDEPSTGLDSGSKSQLIAWIETLRADGHALVISTHDGSVTEACTSTFDVTTAERNTFREASKPSDIRPLVERNSCSRESGGAFGVRHHLRTQAWLTQNGVAGLLALGLLIILGDVGSLLSSTQVLGLVLAPAMAVGLTGEGMVNLGREERTHEWRRAVGLGTPHSGFLPLVLGAAMTAMATWVVNGEVVVAHVAIGSVLSLAVTHCMRFLQHSVDRLSRPNAVFVGLFTPVLLLPYALLVDWLG